MSGLRSVPALTPRKTSAGVQLMPNRISADVKHMPKKNHHDNVSAVRYSYEFITLRPEEFVRYHFKIRVPFLSGLGKHRTRSPNEVG